jgi:hypothetical protein
MRRVWPWTLVALGTALVVGGFGYDLMFAGIPYQDPPPELAAQYGRHQRIAATLGDIGLGIGGAGLLGIAIRTIRRLRP